MQSKMRQAFYRPGKAKAPMTFKSLTEMEKALESGISSLKGKKKKDEEEK